MSRQPDYSAAAPVTYKDKDGNEKERWINMGVAFKTVSGTGQINVLIDALPVGWTGKICLFPWNGGKKPNPLDLRMTPDDPRKF